LAARARVLGDEVFWKVEVEVADTHDAMLAQRRVWRAAPAAVHRTMKPVSVFATLRESPAAI
jgi:hypothetical protein